MKNCVVLRRKYGNIVYSKDNLNRFSDFWKYSFGSNTRKALVITDSNVFSAQGKTLELLFSAIKNTDFHWIVLEAGEGVKSMDNVQKVWMYLSENHWGVNDVVVSVGGGTISDLSGFVAATFKRGLRLLTIPTTILAACDAALGGKNGVNFSEYKNHIGSFYFPRLTFVDTQFFTSLPSVEFLSGCSEMIKHGLLKGGNLLNDLLKIDYYSEQLPFPLLVSSSRYKLSVVDKDERENNARAYLNLGHTLGHAFESLLWAKGTPITHGCAVAWGMQFALFVSKRLFFLKGTPVDKTNALLLTLFGIRKDISWIDLVDYIKQDKKNQSYKVGFIALKKVGEPCKIHLELSEFEKLYIDFCSE